MMKFQSDFVILLVIFSFLVISCEYQPDGNNYRNLQKPDSNLTINVELTPEEFPEILDEPFLLKYQYYPTDLSLLGVRILIDDITWFESTHLQDSFQVSPYDLEAGYRKLSIEFITISKSESLAGLTGHEVLIFRREWEFYKPDVCYSGICINRVFNDNGILKLEWNTTSLPGFRKYKIYKMCEIFDSPRVIAEFNDLYQAEYYDGEYFGGWADYWVEVETETRTVSSRTIYAYYLYPRLEVQWIRGTDIMMYWNKSPFDKVVMGYELSFATSDTTSSILFATDNPMDTTYLLNGTATYELNRYTLRIKIQGPDPGQSMWSDFSSSVKLNYKPKYYPIYK
ncbi:MAG: hypothetical protein JXB49_33605 [Bacteroidales bacterium]|nr:hypothetical protein [Bacteroidales bacterium]